MIRNLLWIFLVALKKTAYLCSPNKTARGQTIFLLLKGKKIQHKVYYKITNILQESCKSNYNRMRNERISVCDFIAYLLMEFSSSVCLFVFRKFCLQRIIKPNKTACIHTIHQSGCIFQHPNATCSDLTAASTSHCQVYVKELFCGHAQLLADLFHWTSKSVSLNGLGRWKTGLWHHFMRER